MWVVWEKVQRLVHVTGKLEMPSNEVGKRTGITVDWRVKIEVPFWTFSLSDVVRHQVWCQVGSQVWTSGVQG